MDRRRALAAVGRETLIPGQCNVVQCFPASLFETHLFLQFDVFQLFLKFRRYWMNRCIDEKIDDGKKMCIVIQKGQNKSKLKKLLKIQEGK